MTLSPLAHQCQHRTAIAAGYAARHLDNAKTFRQIRASNADPLARRVWANAARNALRDAKACRQIRAAYADALRCLTIAAAMPADAPARLIMLRSADRAAMRGQTLFGNL